MQRVVFLLLLFCGFWLEARLQQRQNIFFHYDPENSKYPGGVMMETFAQEQRGILWMGSRNGLARFDGNNFQYFRANTFDSTSITGNNIASLHINEHLLYGGTYGNGFFVMDLLTLKARRVLLPGETRMASYSITMIAPAGKDSLLLSADKIPLIKMHRTNFGVREIRLSGKGIYPPANGFKKYVPKKDVPDIGWLLSHEAIIFGNTNTGQVQQQTFKIDDGLFKKEPINDLSAMLIQNDSIAWVAAFYDGLIEWNYRSGQYCIHRVKTNNTAISNINDLSNHSASLLWLATSNSGVISFDLTNKKFSEEKNYAFRSARVFFKDQYKGTWISSANGLGYYHPGYPVFERFDFSLPGAGDRLLLLKWINRDQAVWSTGTKKKTGVFDRNTYQSTAIKYGNSDKGGFHSATLLYDKWILKSVADGFYSIAPNAKGVERFYMEKVDFLMEKVDVNGVAPTRHGLLFTSSKGIVVIDTLNKIIRMHKKFQHKDSLHNNFLKEPQTDKYGQTWLAGIEGISIYNPVTKIFKQVSALADREFHGLGQVSGMKFSTDGDKVFIATRDKGLFILDARTHRLITQYNEDNFLPDNQLLHLGLSNHDSLIWAAANRTISCINRYTNEVSTWDAFNSGLPFGNRGYCFDISGDGNILTGDSIIHLLAPNKPLAVDIHPFISYFKTNRINYTPDSIIRLSRDQSYVEIFMGCNWLADQRNISYEYRLNEKEEWMKADKGRILMADVRNGHTRIFIRVRLTGPVSGIGYAEINLKRPFFFYQSMWFKIALVVLLILLGWLSQRRRVRKNKERYQLEKRIQEMDIAFLRTRLNPHFIFNTLSSLRYLVLSGENDRASHYILRLSKLLRMVLHQSETQTVSIDEELELIDLYLQLEALRFNYGFEYSIVKVNAPLFEIGVPSMILQPFVENAIRHGLAASQQVTKKIAVTVEYQSATVAVISIEDNGIGMANSKCSSSTSHQSVGLHLTQQRIKNFNDTHAQKIGLKIMEADSSDSKNPGTLIQLFYNFQP